MAPEDGVSADWIDIRRECELFRSGRAWAGIHGCPVRLGELSRGEWPGNGYGIGLAMHRSFLTYVATVVEVQLDDAGQVHIKRVNTAVDAGTVVNPEMVRQQFEGAAVMGTSLAFYGEITATGGVIDQSNFNDFRMARMNNSPRETNVYIVPSDAPPAGIGEPGLPPFAPAICNAIFAATGKRIRELPLSKAGLA